jgi:hyperosmotically inducible protein
MKCWVFALGLALTVGCKMSEDEVREKAGDAAVAGKRALDTAGEASKQAYDQAVEKTKELAAKAGEVIDDTTLRGKVLAGFRLIKDLDTSNVQVEVKDGFVTATGTVKTERERMMVEGVLYGIAGTGKYENEVQVKA